MLHVVKQYKHLFISFVTNRLEESGGGSPREIVKAVDKASTSDNILTMEEYNILLEQFKDNKDILNKLVSDKDNLDMEVSEAINSYYESKEDISNQTMTDKISLSGDIFSIDKFNRTLKLGDIGEDVKLLQIFLFKKYFIKGAKINGIFDDITETALKGYQISLGSTKPDGIMTINSDGKSGGRIYNGLKKDFTRMSKRANESNTKEKENNGNEITLINSIDYIKSNFNQDQQNIAFFDMTNETSFKNLQGDREFVKKIQESLINLGYTLKGKNNGVDGKLGNSTLSMLKLEQSKLINKIQEAKYVDDIVPTIEEKELRNSDLDTAQKAIGDTKESVINLKNKLIITAKLNERLGGSNYFYKEGNGYSIEALIRKYTKTDKYADILEEKEKYDQLFESSEGKAKLERAVKYLVGNNVNNDILDINTEKDNYNILEGIKKGSPWLLGLYLFDIPLSFLQTITRGADINKSLAFYKWIGGGMQGEFDEYSIKESEGSNVLKKQFSLRGILTTLNISEEDQSIALSEGLNKLNEETRKLILAYGMHRVLPDLKLLNSQSFGFLDRLFDEKSDKADELIKKLEDSLENGVIDFSPIEEFLNLVIEEGDVSENVIKPVSDRYNYFGEVISQDKIFQYIEWLSGLGADAQSLSILFYTKNIDGLLGFGISEKGKLSLEKAYDLIVNKDKKGLIQLLNSDTDLKNIVTKLGTAEYDKVLLANIPQIDNLKYVDVGIAKHGLSLLGLSNEEAFKLATTTTSEKGSKFSSLALAYKSQLEKGGTYGITYEEYENAFKNKQTVAIDSITDKPIINTGRKEGQLTLSSFKSLAKNRGDTEVFKMEDIVKEYTYYKDGKEITIEVTYNLYIRPECINPLIVPNSIKTVISEKSPEFNSTTYIGVDRYIPFILPWFLGNNLGLSGKGGTSGGGAHGSSIPGGGTSGGSTGGGITF